MEMRGMVEPLPEVRSLKVRVRAGHGGHLRVATEIMIPTIVLGIWIGMCSVVIVPGGVERFYGVAFPLRSLLYSTHPTIGVGNQLRTILRVGLVHPRDLVVEMMVVTSVHLSLPRAVVLGGRGRAVEGG
jgi:hypothetical protein